MAGAQFTVKTNNWADIVLSTIKIYTEKCPCGGMVDAADSKSVIERCGSSSLPEGIFIKAFL